MPARAPATETDLPDADPPEFTRLVESFGVTESPQQPWVQAARLTVPARVPADGPFTRR